jgi:glycosyltransferase involved in cell wall biosynthesis
MLNSGHSIDPITTPEQKLMAKTEPAISIVLPIYNEEENVEGLVEDIIETMENCGTSFEILAVNDGSRDGTLDILKSLVKKYPRFLRVASHVVNKGNGASLRTGIRHARGEIVVTMDADGQHSPKDILELVSHIPPFDMVVAARTKGYQGKFHRNLANGIYNGLASWLTRTEILDLTSGFRAMRRKAVTHFLHLYPSGFSAPTTITMALLKAGYNVKFIPIDVKPRTKGKSKINLFRDGGRFITIILKVIMLYDPLRIFMPATFAMLLLGVITMIFGIIVAQRLVVPGSSVVLFMSALTIFLLGLVSSQISNATIFYFGDESLILYEEQSEQ